METRRLRLLLELARRGSMREVAEALDVTTSTVSQQIAALAREVDAVLVEPEGRRVRLTPAGRRLAEHAVTILAAVESARADLGAGAEPAGDVRVAATTTSIRRWLLPVIAELGVSHPAVRVLLFESEPAEAAALLAADGVDLAIAYDHNLVPVAFDRSFAVTPLGTTPWGLGVPALAPHPSPATAPATFAVFREASWIVNSRNTADEQVVRIIASMAGFAPRIAHQIDRLDLVQELIVAGQGVAILPFGRAVLPGIQVLPLADPDVAVRSCALTRRGRRDWPPLALVLDRLVALASDRPLSVLRQ